MEKLTVSAGQDIIAFIAHQLGFVPKESLVLLALTGGSIGATLRMELPHGTADARDYAVKACSYLLTEENADGTLFVLYTAAGDGHPHAEMVETLMQELNKAGIPARNGWLVTAQGWKDYLCVEDCCTGLAPLEAITDSVLNAELTFRGSSYEKDAAAHIPACTGTAATEQAVTDTAARFSVGDPNDATAEPMRTARTLWDRALTGGLDPLDPAATVEVLAYFQHVSIRDRLMADLISTDTDPDVYGRTLLGECPTVPTWNRVDAGQALLTQLLETAAGAHRAPLLTALGWISWNKGRGQLAASYLDHALGAAPGYRLAVLLKELTGRGHVAKVAQRKATGYRKG